MMDVRLKDSIRNTEQQVEAMKIEMRALVEDMKTVTTIVREIKKSVVRKYGSGE